MLSRGDDCSCWSAPLHNKEEGLPENFPEKLFKGNDERDKKQNVVLKHISSAKGGNEYDGKEEGVTTSNVDLINNYYSGDDHTGEIHTFFRLRGLF